MLCTAHIMHYTVHCFGVPVNFKAHTCYLSETAYCKLLKDLYFN